ncbi:helix-turn-helix domain-containing protein [Gilliamella sp. GillExp13]|uniref:helix-turn-helix domain-containing protein n=1 Tax=Gilliamella sp. GillExp13 TaxID=3120243 RepID=UPI0009BD009A|nr:helix-turn-helix domain-containing protein [Gilliamella apicola]
MYYNHLSRKERYQIFVLLQAGKNKKEIAQLLNRHPSTISREIKMVVCPHFLVPKR